MNPTPLLVFDTNILIDIWLERDQGNQSTSSAKMILGLIENGHAELAIPEFVLTEYQGTARRWISEQQNVAVSEIRKRAKAFYRVLKLKTSADDILQRCAAIQTALDHLKTEIEITIARIRRIAQIYPHTETIHMRGELRFLRGDPPDRLNEGLKDCRIYEAILDIAECHKQDNTKTKILLTKDSDFSLHPSLATELDHLGFKIATDPNQLYGQLYRASRLSNPP